MKLKPVEPKPEETSEQRDCRFKSDLTAAVGDFAFKPIWVSLGPRAEKEGKELSWLVHDICRFFSTIKERQSDPLANNARAFAAAISRHPDAVGSVLHTEVILSQNVIQGMGYPVACDYAESLARTGKVNELTDTDFLKRLCGLRGREACALLEKFLNAGSGADRAGGS